VEPKPVSAAAATSGPPDHGRSINPARQTRLMREIVRQDDGHLLCWLVSQPGRSRHWSLADVHQIGLAEVRAQAVTADPRHPHDPDAWAGVHDSRAGYPNSVLMTNSFGSVISSMV
jgi:hypothetical protein